MPSPKCLINSVNV